MFPSTSVSYLQHGTRTAVPCWHRRHGLVTLTLVAFATDARLTRGHHPHPPDAALLEHELGARPPRSSSFLAGFRSRPLPSGFAARLVRGTGHLHHPPSLARRRRGRRRCSHLHGPGCAARVTQPSRLARAFRAFAHDRHPVHAYRRRSPCRVRQRSTESGFAAVSNPLPAPWVLASTPAFSYAIEAFLTPPHPLSHHPVTGWCSPLAHVHHSPAIRLATWRVRARHCSPLVALFAVHVTSSCMVVKARTPCSLHRVAHPFGEGANHYHHARKTGTHGPR